ncbi:tetratricopeptide repeat protein, partial [bacterium]|nr:tetratricopeptide repeat protein [candidate division CSSED10-310 bacterium]
ASEARVWWERALSHEPGAAEAHANLGTAAAVTGNWESAEWHYTQAVSIQPYYFLGWLQLAQVHQAQNDMIAAISAFTHALELQPDHPQALFGLARCYQAAGQRREAETTWIRYLAVATGNDGEAVFIEEARRALETLSRPDESADTGGPGGQPSECIP